MVKSWKGVRRGAAAGAVLALAVALGACGGNDADSASSGGGDQRTVVVADGGGAYHDSLVKSTYEPFEKATGIKVVSTSYDYTAGAIKAQVAGAKQWDVVSVPRLDEQQQAELFAPIDYEAVDQPGMPDWAKGKYGLAYVGTGYGVVYRTDKFEGNEPKGWGDVWDVDGLPGPRLLYNNPFGTLEAALLADGVAWKDMYPLDVDRGLAKLSELDKKAKIVWFSTGAEQIQFLSGGNGVIGLGWYGRIVDAQKQSVPVAFSNHESFANATAWSILKTAPHSKEANEFVKFVTSPETNAQDAIEFPGNMPLNSESYALLPKELSDSLPSSPKYSDQFLGYASADWWAENYADVLERWQAWYAEAGE
jgi:putative spermidine/putrescine transport system substrate-binding protein